MYFHYCKYSLHNWGNCLNSQDFFINELVSNMNHPEVAYLRLNKVEN